MKNAFTMIEIIFVIVVLGILAAVAVPKLAATRDDAEVAKIRSDIASIRSAIISERQTRLIRGNSNYISSLDNSAISNVSDQQIFDTNGSGILLQYAVLTKEEGTTNTPQSGNWLKIANNQYSVNAGGSVVTFDYNSTSGTFTCDITHVTYGSACKILLY